VHSHYNVPYLIVVNMALSFAGLYAIKHITGRVEGE
jgi:hypothetical protein